MFAKKSILAIDDNAEQLYLNRLILESEGYEVFTALGGSEALSLLSEIKTPDLILLDLQMADMSGPDFLKILEEKKPEILEKVPVVFLTAMDEVPPSNAKGSIRKPIDLDKFTESVFRFIKMETTSR